MLASCFYVLPIKMPSNQEPVIVFQDPDRVIQVRGPEAWVTVRALDRDSRTLNFSFPDLPDIPEQQGWTQKYEGPDSQGAYVWSATVLIKDTSLIPDVFRVRIEDEDLGRPANAQWTVER